MQQHLSMETTLNVPIKTEILCMVFDHGLTPFSLDGEKRRGEQEFAAVLLFIIESFHISLESN